MNYAPTEDMNGKRKHKSTVLNDFVGAGLALPGSEQGCEQVMAVAHKKGAASGAPTCTQNAATQKHLPEGWVWKTLVEVAEVIGGGTPRTNMSAYFFSISDRMRRFIGDGKAISRND